jgi:RNA polymerase sigma-70 factor (ECF subfamily)
MFSIKVCTIPMLRKGLSGSRGQVIKQSTPPNHSFIAHLYQRSAPELLQYIRRHVPTQEDAEDVLLEAFTAALEKPDLSTMSQQEQLAWLRRVAHNKFVDFYRRSTRQTSIPLQDLQHELYDEDEHTPELVAMGSERQAQLRSHLALLPQIQQEVLRLRFAEDLRCPEIAKRLQKSDGAIRIMLSRVLNVLRTIYANSEEGLSNG